MSRVTYSDLLPTISSSILKISGNEKNIQKILNTNENMIFELKTYFSSTDLYMKKDLWNKYEVSIQNIFEIEQLLSFISSNEKDILYNKTLENGIRSIKVASEIDSNLGIYKSREDEVYGVNPLMMSNFLYEEKLNLKNFKLISNDVEGFLEEIEKNKISLKDLDVSTNLFCVKTKCSIIDIENIFNRNVSLLRKILSTKIVEEKELLKPKVHYRNFRLNLDDKNISRLRNIFVYETLTKNEKSGDILKELQNITENLEYRINSKINKSLESTILFEERKYFDLYIEQIRANIIPNLTISKVMSNYNDIILKEIEYKKSKIKYSEPTYQYNEYLTNSIRDLIKNDQMESVEFKNAMDRYKEVMVEHLLLTKEKPINNIIFLKFVEEHFNQEQIQKIQKKYPDVFFTEEDKNWFSFEYDNNMMNFTIKEGYFLLNRIDILSHNIKELLNIWSEIEDLNIPTDLIVNINKKRVFAYAKQPEKFKALSENQKNNVVISIFDAMVNAINNEKQNNITNSFKSGIKEVSTLISLKNVKKEAYEVTNKKKI